MQIPPANDIPPLPDDTNPGSVPPFGPGETEPDLEDFPLEPDDPGQSPDLPPARDPFPDDIEPPVDHPNSL